MLGKLAILFLCLMAVILMIFGRPKRGDRIWSVLRSPRRRRQAEAERRRRDGDRRG